MWKNRVRTVIWKLFKISVWNFIQILSIRRRHTEHKNNNSCLYKFGVMPPLTLEIAACLSKPCLFYKMKTIQVIFIKQYLSLPYFFESIPLCSIMYKAASFQWDREALTCISLIGRQIHIWLWLVPLGPHLHGFHLYMTIFTTDWFNVHWFYDIF